MKLPSHKQNFVKVACAEQARVHKTLTAAARGPGRAPGQRFISSSEWQRERALRLHRICGLIKARLERAQSRFKAARYFSRRWSGKPFASDPTRRFKLNVGTLYRLYLHWLRTGETPAAFRLKYIRRCSVFTAPLLRRFVNFFVNHPQRSMRQAWDEFARRGGNAGIGRRASKPLKISYGQLRYNFPAAKFYQIRAEQDAIVMAQKNLAAMQQKLVAEIGERFPERPPRRRVKREVDFQI